MPLQFVRTNIVHMDVDAIVNAANSSLAPGGGVCGAIFAAADYDRLDRACRRIGHCDVGEAVATPGFGLKARWVIHAVGPIWRDGLSGERTLLRSAYQNALSLAVDKRCASIAFPLISSGIYGYPKEEAFRVAVDTIRDFLMEHELLVYLILFDPASMLIGQQRCATIQSYIDDHYVDDHSPRRDGDFGTFRHQLEEQAAASDRFRSEDFASQSGEREPKEDFFSTVQSFFHLRRKRGDAEDTFARPDSAPDSSARSAERFGSVSDTSARSAERFGSAPDTFSHPAASSGSASDTFSRPDEGSSSAPDTFTRSAEGPGSAPDAFARPAARPGSAPEERSTARWESEEPSAPQTPTPWGAFAPGAESASPGRVEDAPQAPSAPPAGAAAPDPAAPFGAARRVHAPETGRSAASLPRAAERPPKRSLEDLLFHLEESFSEALLQLIDEKGMTDVEVYKRANLDRKLFSKLRKRSYRPSKQTAVALAIALRLNLDETTDLLRRAGYALSPSNRADVIVRYFIEERSYDIFAVNEALFAFGEKLLGA